MEWTHRQQLEALKGIWIRPRQTIRTLLDEEATLPLTYLWVPLFGITFAAVQVFLRDFGDLVSFPKLLFSFVWLGILLGAVFWLIYSVLFLYLGRLWGGTGTWREIHTALAWAFVPYLGKLILGLFQLLLFGSELFMRETPRLDQHGLLLILYLFLLLLDAILTIWFYFVLFKSIAEAHRFSVWKAIPVVLLGIGIWWILALEVFHILFFPL